LNIKKKKIEWKNAFGIIVFLLPFTVFYALFTIWPVIQGFYVSLYKWGLMGKIKFVGMANYTRFLKDKFFWQSLGNTATFVIVAVPLLVILALGLALLANRTSKLKRFYRASYYLPNILSVSVISFITIYMASPYMGFVNGLLHTLKLIPANVEPQWLSNTSLTWATIAITTVWWTVGFSMLLYISALQDIPDQLYEATRIDGASKVRQLFSITIPLLKPTTYLVLLLQVIASFKVFGQIFLITRGGPGTMTRPLIQYIYETAFTKNDMGYASAMSYALFLILVILSALQIQIQNRRDKV